MADTREIAEQPLQRTWSWPVAGIHAYLIGLTLSLLLPLLAFASLLGMRYADAERRVVEAQRIDVTNNLHDLIERELERIAGVLHGVSTSPDLAAGRWVEFQSHAGRAARLANFDRITLSDRYGRPIAGTSSPSAVTLDNLMLEAIAAGNVAVSNVRLDLPPSASFLVTVPALIDGDMRYALTAVVALYRLQPLFAEARLPQDWVAAALDRRGTVLARSRAAEHFVGQPARAEAIAATQGKASEGVFTNVTLDGVGSTTAFRRSRHGWTAVVAVPTTVLNAPRNRAMVTLASIGLALSSLGLGLSFALGGRIARAARDLQQSALDVISGRQPALTSQPIRELRQVAQSFDYAADLARERKAADERLRDSEERLRLAIDAGAFGTWDLDVRSGTAVWSEPAFRMLGYQPEASGLASMQMWLDRLPPEDRVTVIAQLEHAKIHRGRYESEHRILRADNGAISWLRKTGQFHYDDAGNAVRFVGVMRDITDRKAVEAELVTSQARYKSALKVGRIGSWETNFDTGQRIWSDEGQALFGLHLADGIGQIGGDTDEFRAALHPEDRHLVERFHQLAQTQDVFTAEYRIVRPDGNVIWAAGRGHVVARGIDGKALRMVSVVADITERKSAELHAAFLMQEIAHRSKNLLAVVQAIAARTARSATSMADFDTRFRKRLHGLATSNDILISQQWQRAPLRELVRKQLMPFVDDATARVKIEGPDLTVDATAAQAIGGTVTLNYAETGVQWSLEWTQVLSGIGESTPDYWTNGMSQKSFDATDPSPTSQDAEQ